MEEIGAFYFTFGYGQRHRRTGAPMTNCYTVIEGTYDEARVRMIELFDNTWAFQYYDAESAGVERFDLRYVPPVSWSPGELLPPTAHEQERGSWRLQTLTFYDHLEPPENYYVIPCYPTFEELRRVMDAHGVPANATVEYADCGSHELTVEWDTPLKRKLERRRKAELEADLEAYLDDEDEVPDFA